MADNVAVTPGSGATIATDDVSGVQYQRVKVSHGVDGSAVDASSTDPLPVLGFADPAGYAPGYDIPDPAEDRQHVDPDGNLRARAAVLTDEGGYRVNFSGSSISYSLGTCTFTNGSPTVTGSGFGSTPLLAGDYIKLNADGESAWAQVLSLDSATQLTLTANYSGTSATGAASYSKLKTVTGAGASITVASGQCTIAAGTTALALTEIERDMDWLPLVKQCGVSVSQRIANQSIYIGFYDELHPTTPYWFAWFLLDGTTNTTVKCQSARRSDGAPSAAETEESTVTLPHGRTTANALRYRIEVIGDRTMFYIDGILVATHFRSLPGLGDLLTSTIRVVNGTTPASGTSIVVDYDTCKNHNKVEVGMLSDTERVTAEQPALERFSYNVAGIITINTVLLLIDCQRYKSLTFQCTSMGTTGVVTPEWSSDGTTWVGDTFFTIAGATATTFNAAGSWVTNVRLRYFRLRLSTATTAGTTTINLDGCAQRQPTFLSTQPVSGTVSVTTTRIQPNAADGHSTTHHLISAASTNATSVKGSAGAIGLIAVSNINAAVRYFKLYNKASAPTVGTDTPILTAVIPPNQTLIIGGNSPIRCSTGIAYALTTGITVADTGAVAASEHSVSIFYT